MNKSTSAMTTESQKETTDALPSPSITADPDREELARHEATIADSLTRGFIEAGTALQIIQDKKLYKEQFDSFDAYVQSRWGWQRAHAYRLIQAAQTVSQLSPIGDTSLRLPMPTSESQLRPLSRLDAEMQRLVWMKAVEDAGGRTPTADIVKAAVVGVVGPGKKTIAAVPADAIDGRTTGPSTGQAPVEQQGPGLGMGASVPPGHAPALQPALETPSEVRTDDEGASHPDEAGPASDGSPAAVEAVSANETDQMLPVFHLADGTAVPATEWVDGWIAAKWITGMLRDLERQSSLGPMSVERCSRRQRVLIAVAATLNRSGSDPDPEHLQDMEDALGSARNIVRTHSNYPHLIKTRRDLTEPES